MKLHILSDLHLEFAPHEVDQEASRAADVIVLAGDIHTGTQGIHWARQSFPDKPIVYVAGNHEFYGHHWDKLLDELRSEATARGVHFLENDAITIEGVRFLGATLWTDFDYFGRGKRHANMLAAEAAMNDFRLIKAKTILPREVSSILGRGDGRLGPIRWTRKLTPVHTLGRHQASLAWLKEELPKGDPDRTVVVTHHYSHKNSCAPVFSDEPLTAFYGSHVDADVLLGARLWIHGHTHGSCDYCIDDTPSDVKKSARVVCNPRGYPRQNTWHNASFQPGLILETV